MRIAIDTNRYSDFVDGDPTTGQIIATAERIYVPFIVLAELRFGFLRGTRMAENEQRLITFLSRPRVEPMLPNEMTTFEYAKLAVQLRKQGTPIPVNDIWMAALVVQHNLTLFARDKHFDHLAQVARV